MGRSWKKKKKTLLYKISSDRMGFHSRSHTAMALQWLREPRGEASQFLPSQLPALNSGGSNTKNALLTLLASMFLPRAVCKKSWESRKKWLCSAQGWLQRGRGHKKADLLGQSSYSKGRQILSQFQECPACTRRAVSSGPSHAAVCACVPGSSIWSQHLQDPFGLREIPAGNSPVPPCLQLSKPPSWSLALHALASTSLRPPWAHSCLAIPVSPKPAPVSWCHQPSAKQRETLPSLNLLSTPSHTEKEDSVSRSSSSRLSWRPKYLSGAKLSFLLSFRIWSWRLLWLHPTIYSSPHVIFGISISKCFVGFVLLWCWQPGTAQFSFSNWVFSIFPVGAALAFQVSLKEEKYPYLKKIYEFLLLE